MRNNNSSRFGKYIEIFFNGRGQIMGARNTQYLLEKIRVVKQNRNERNYHSFYQLVMGADGQLAETLSLEPNPANFDYLNQSGCLEIVGVSDADEFQEMQRAFQELLFAPKEVESMGMIFIFGCCLNVCECVCLDPAFDIHSTQPLILVMFANVCNECGLFLTFDLWTVQVCSHWCRPFCTWATSSFAPLVIALVQLTTRRVSNMPRACWV